MTWLYRRQLLVRFYGLAIATICIASALTGCAVPRSAVALEKLKLEGEPYYVEHRRHECGNYGPGGISCEHECRSMLWNVWRTSGSPQQKLETLDQEMSRLGFQRNEEEYAKKREKDHWVLLYKDPQGVDASVMVGQVSPDGGLFSGWPPRRDRTSLEGEFVYGVGASYQTMWDRLDEHWKNASWFWRECSGNEPLGLPRRP